MYTYVLLEVSAAAYDEIAEKLRAAGYQHAFIDAGTIDMHGIALVREAVDSGICKTCRGHDGRHASMCPELG